MITYTIGTKNGTRDWQADDALHAVRQHYDCFGRDDPYETVISVKPKDMTCTIEHPCEDCVALDTFLAARDAFVDMFKGVDPALDETLNDMNATIDDIQNAIDDHITTKDNP